MKIFTPRMVLLVALACAMVLRQAWASTVSYDLTGDPNLGSIYGGQTLARVTLTDITGGVSFSVEALIPGSRISQFGFNFLNDTQPSGFAVNGLPANWGATVDINNQKGFNGFGWFDVDVRDSGQNNWLSPLTFSVTGGTVDSYIALSYMSGQPPNLGNSLFSAHVTNLDALAWGSCSAADNGNTCTALTGYAGIGTEVTVPVPATLWLFGSGLFGMAAISRRKRRS